MPKWKENILLNLSALRTNKGPHLASVISGSKIDQDYWQSNFHQTRRNVFRADGKTEIVSVLEASRLGNFLGTLNAWAEIKKRNHYNISDVGLLSVVFGKGKRLSPFTQAMGNRKPALLTPYGVNRQNRYLNTANLSNLYANHWINFLRDAGFNGLIVKWGDEAIIPENVWSRVDMPSDGYDCIRFISHIDMTPTLAREKEWIVYEKGRNIMLYELLRQNVDSLVSRMASFTAAFPSATLAVNLGSFAISYDFLDLALEIFIDDLSEKNRWVDWDPYLWIALFCESIVDWEREKDIERLMGKRGIVELEARFPDFYSKVLMLKNVFETRHKRKIRVGVLDFGDALWIDFGLHSRLRHSLETLCEDSPMGETMRQIFNIPIMRDKNGNTIINSEVPSSNNIRDSVIIDSKISDSKSIINRGVIIGSNVKEVSLPKGGSVLFSAGEKFVFSGNNAIAYRALTDQLLLEAGDRYTTMFLPTGSRGFLSNESIVDYESYNYEMPIMGNSLSFSEAGYLMERVNNLEMKWHRLWNQWNK